MGTEAAEPALTRFVEEQQHALTRLAYLLCGDRYVAEDLVQEVFTSMFRRFGEVLPLEYPSAYARTAIVNAHLSRARRRWTRERPVGLSIDDDRSTETSATGPAIGGRVWTALLRLPERQRAVLVLRYYADLSDADIAATLRCRVGTVSSAVSRAMAALRRDASLTEEQR